ncbi:hypothetical protein FC678_20125 [Peribacillus simplex]|uniref:Uncharacterized protein n=1 Tax=Peribacillus simplex TaxID=1478 RepID=A0A9X8ZEM4_9BACI|nr:hypothetical protein [Peribacillus simplex]TKH08509.1 hypothetical protein FC678_20125 [Peribacillus simplex]
MEAILKFFLYLSTFATTIGFWIMSAMVHIYTIYITFVYEGIFWGAISIFTPGLAQLVWMFNFTKALGFLNTYNIIVIGVFVLQFVFALISTLIENKVEKIEEAK